METKSLYELVGRTRKSILLKSVFIKAQRSYEGYPIIEIETYNDAFEKATRTNAGKEKTSLYIDKSIKKYADVIRYHLSITDKEFWIIDYSTFGRHVEYILDCG